LPPPSAIIWAAILQLPLLPPLQQSFCCFHRSKTWLLSPQQSFSCLCCTLTILQPTLLPLQRHSYPTTDSTSPSRLHHQQPSYRSRRILAIFYHCFLSAPSRLHHQQPSFRYRCTLTISWTAHAAASSTAPNTVASSTPTTTAHTALSPQILPLLPHGYITYASLPCPPSHTDDPAALTDAPASAPLPQILLRFPPGYTSCASLLPLPSHPDNIRNSPRCSPHHGS
jgi:hypothetical protein